MEKCLTSRSSHLKLSSTLVAACVLRSWSAQMLSPFSSRRTTAVAAIPSGCMYNASPKTTHVWSANDQITQRITIHYFCLECSSSDCTTHHQSLPMSGVQCVRSYIPWPVSCRHAFAVAAIPSVRTRNMSQKVSLHLKSNASDNAHSDLLKKRIGRQPRSRGALPMVQANSYTVASLWRRKKIHFLITPSISVFHPFQFTSHDCNTRHLRWVHCNPLPSMLAKQQ